MVVDLDLPVESRKSRFQVAAYVRVVGARARFDVLLRHRLLRKADGFEGVDTVREPLHAKDPLPRRTVATNHVRTRPRRRSPLRARRPADITKTCHPGINVLDLYRNPLEAVAVLMRRTEASRPRTAPSSQSRTGTISNSSSWIANQAPVARKGLPPIDARSPPSPATSPTQYLSAVCFPCKAAVLTFRPARLCGGLLLSRGPARLGKQVVWRAGVLVQSEPLVAG